MSTTTMTYNELYTKMVKKFTVEKNDTDYKLGEYMLAKAKKKKESTTTMLDTASSSSALPMPVSNKDGAMVAIFSYVKDKLKVKEAPIRNKTIRRFPIRASLSAFCSALVVCSLIVVCGIFGIKAAPFGANDDNYVAVDTENENIEDNNETITASKTE